jgi:GT2 family glycosyltransferase
MKKTSIIFTSFNLTNLLANIGMLALSNIRLYTEPSEYELIIIETTPKYALKDHWGGLELKKAIHVINEEDKGYCADMNQGAALATGDYLCFIENDIFVYEGWLPTLRYYLDNDMADAIIPNQIPVTRAQHKLYEKMTWEEAYNPGVQEAGMIMMTREAFDKADGWDPRFREIFGWAAMEKRLVRSGSRIRTTHKTSVGHIRGATYYHHLDTDKVRLDKVQDVEAKIREGEYA